MKMPHLLRVSGVLLVLLCAAHGVLAQLNQDCTVSVLNRTVQVNADGSWVLPNVPANFGQVKARATCVRNGVTISGESDYFTIPANGAVNLPTIVLGAATPIPTTLGIGPANPSFTSAGQTTQLVVTAVYADNSTKDVSAASTGTNYTSSNPAIATVNANGLVTAVSSGTVVIQASNDGATGITKATVLLSNVDSDGDGIPDDIEVSLGLDPHNPVDAQEDFDRDGLTNLKEFQLGTGLRVFDTDGDGIGDGLEVESGSNPLDPNSFNLAQVLKSIKVTPASVALTVNTIIGLATQQLTVTGTLTDGNFINLTARSRGTNYSSSNLSVANFGATDGLVFAGNNGTATITVSNNGHTATVQVSVTSFSPTALSFISIPGFANNVDVSGNFAYVAAGSTGLQVVDVSDRRAPRIIGSLDTPGNANDVRVVGNRAYIADGSAGLRIIDVTNPASPTLLGALDTPGEANDVVVVGNLAYVADGPAGLQIIDVSDPVAPRLVGTLDTPGTARGVDVSGNIAVIADGNSLRTVDISNPASPVALGSLTTTDARDLTVEGTVAYLADFSGSLKTIDISTPAAPRLLATTPQSLGGILMDVAKVREFVFGADVFFVNGVPIVNVSDPANPSVRARLDFPARDDNGTGIAVDNQFVYLTADRSIQENGVNGDSRLYIGQYVALEDKAGIPPVVSISSPAAGSTVIEGTILPITVQATDDVQVAAVDFLVNGNIVFTDSASPYQFNLTVPTGVTTLTLGATAVDIGNNVGTAANVQINVIPDPLTTVIGRVIDESSGPVSGATVSVLGHTALTGVDGSFSIPNVLTVQGNLVVNVTFTNPDATVLSGSSAPTPPVAGGTTNVGDIIARAAGKFAVVSINNLNQAAIIDLSTNSIRTKLSTGITPTGASVTPDGRLGIVSNFSSGNLTFIDLTTDPPAPSGTLATTPLMPAPESVAITPNGRYGIVADGGSEKDVLSIDLQQRSIVSSVSGLPGNQGAVVSPDGTLVLILSADTNQVSVLTINANGVLTDTGQRVALSGSVGGPRCIAITPDGHRALVTNTGSVITVLSITGSTVTNIGAITNLGPSTSGIAIGRDGRKAYVSNLGNSTIAVLSIDTNDNVTDTGRRIFIPSGTPNTFFGVPGLAITPDGTRLFIAGASTGNLSVLDTATETLIPVTITFGFGGSPAGIGMPGRP